MLPLYLRTFLALQVSFSSCGDKEMAEDIYKNQLDVGAMTSVRIMFLHGLREICSYSLFHLLRHSSKLSEMVLHIANSSIRSGMSACPPEDGIGS